MKKVILFSLFVTLITNSFAGYTADIKMNKKIWKFQAESNFMKVSSDSSMPVILIDTSGEKLFIINHNKSSYVELTNSELNNTVKAADSLKKVMGNGKFDLKALVNKKQAEKQSNPLMITKENNPKIIAGLKSIKASGVVDKKKYEIFYSTEVMNKLKSELNITSFLKIIRDVVSSKTVFEKLNSDEKIMFYVFDKTSEQQNGGIITSISNGKNNFFYMQTFGAKEIKKDEFIVPSKYKKQSFKDFMENQ